ncbi:hypothetical protein [Rhodococcus sovatensis]|uniref:Uncharacterized protein n=1 Tax=Rhodococcus sovatensis TaxID=1805840 RepID=A0ABZ2PDB0_9NOCA
MRWMTHGKWGCVVATGLPLAAVLLMYYGCDGAHRISLIVLNEIPYP